jgi:hypothetical protein
MLMGIDDLHLDIKREGIYTGILQPVKEAHQHVEDLNCLKNPCIYTLPLDISM